MGDADLSLTETIWFGAFALACAVASTATGIYTVRTLTIALEGHYEFKGDSLTKRSRVAGFTRVILWSVCVVMAWSFLIDWFWFADLDFAITAFLVRLEIVLHILAALGDN